MAKTICAGVLVAAAMSLSLFVSANATAGVGRIQFVTGEANVVSKGGVARRAQAGQEVEEGDVLVTGADGVMQLVMVDKARMSLRPDTRLVLENYEYSDGDDSVGSSVLELVKGGFRTISGLIGERHKPKYEIRTAVATIGIRGTDHETVFIPEPTPGEAVLGEPGAYNRVYDGQTVLATRAGRLNLDAGQIGFAAAADITPVYLKTVPDFLKALPSRYSRLRPHRPREGRAQARRADVSLGADRGATAQNLDPRRRAGASTATTGGPTGPRDDQTQFIPRRVSEGGENLQAALAGARAAPRGTGAVGGGVFVDPATSRTLAASGAVIETGQQGEGILLDNFNNLVGLRQSSGFMYLRGTSAPLDSGTTAVGGAPVNWGIYEGGVAIDPQRGEVRPLFFHYAVTPASTPPSVMQSIGGVVRYDTVADGGSAFTPPVNEAGQVGGQVNNIIANIDFSTLQLLGYGISVTDAAGRNWAGGTTANSPLTADGFRTTLTFVNCAPCTPGPSNGTASVIVFGPSGNGIISSYGMQVGPQAVSGSVIATP